MFALTEVGVAVSWRMDKLLSSRCWAQDTEEDDPYYYDYYYYYYYYHLLLFIIIIISLVNWTLSSGPS